MTLTLIAHGFVAPWPVAQPVLAKHAGQVPVMVGISSGARRSPVRGMESVKTRYYVLVPSVLREPALVRITQVDDGDVTEATTRPAFFMLLASIAVAPIGTWWIWVRPMLSTRPHATQYD